MDPKNHGKLTKRKPVPSSARPAGEPTSSATVDTHTKENEPPSRPPLEIHAIESAQSTASVEQEEEQLVEKARELQLDAFDQEQPSPLLEDADLNLVQSPTTLSEVTSPGSALSESGSSKDRSLWRTAWEETRHFAGGLISHPYEATRHYSILRHSHGLVYYKGPSTRVAITVFADRPLPEDRRIWMQRKGFSGHTGMNMKAFFRGNSSWIDVTPVQRVDASQLPPNDERAWQRDIKKFLKKAPKSVQKHMPKETHVLRIPAAAVDGYFRVVLCSGMKSKTVLCPSPVFRVASTSTDVSVIRGASLTSLPAELTLKVGALIAQNQAANLVSPVTDAIQGQMGQYQPGFLAQEAASTAYSASGVQRNFVTGNERYEQHREASFGTFHSESLLEAGPEVIGDDDGPQTPFPIRLEGRVVQSTGQSQRNFGLPTANLTSVRDDILLRLSGNYFGWSSVVPKESSNTSSDWYPSVISVGPSPYKLPNVLRKNVADVHLIHDFGGTAFFDHKLKVLIMGFLRPLLDADPSTEREKILLEAYRDIAITEASLSRPNWAPDMTLQRIKTERSERSFSEKYVDARQYTQRQIDKVPAHMVGVRMPGAVARDRALGIGGLWVAR